jgi:DNA repair protein RadC
MTNTIEISRKQASYLTLSDTELLGKLVGVRQAWKLYQGPLTALFTSGHDQDDKCVAALELVKRWLCEEIKQGRILSSPAVVRDYLKLHFSGREYESFVALFLDAQHCVIEVEELFRGTLSQTSLYPREVVKDSLHHNAAAVIFAHNHPSGVAEPSQSDRMLTEALK